VAFEGAGAGLHAGNKPAARSVAVKIKVRLDFVMGLRKTQNFQKRSSIASAKTAADKKMQAGLGAPP
jgi:hypothetical protein